MFMLAFSGYASLIIFQAVRLAKYFLVQHTQVGNAHVIKNIRKDSVANNGWVHRYITHSNHSRHPSGNSHAIALTWGSDKHWRHAKCNGCIWGSSSSSLVLLIIFLEIRVEAFWFRFEPTAVEAEPLARVPNCPPENECTSQAIPRSPDARSHGHSASKCQETDPWSSNWTNHAKIQRAHIFPAKYHGRSSTATPPSASCRTSWLSCANRGTSCTGKKHAEKSSHLGELMFLVAFCVHLFQCRFQWLYLPEATDATDLYWLCLLSAWH